MNLFTWKCYHCPGNSIFINRHSSGIKWRKCLNELCSFQWSETKLCHCWTLNIENQFHFHLRLILSPIFIGISSLMKNLNDPTENERINGPLTEKICMSWKQYARVLPRKRSTGYVICITFCSNNRFVWQKQIKTTNDWLQQQQIHRPMLNALKLISN